MKRMSEVFDLPLRCMLGYSDGGAKYWLIEDDNCTELRGEALLSNAAHAINHVDALADALLGAAALLSSAGFESSDEYQSAILAIRSYRGSHD